MERERERKGEGEGREREREREREHGGRKKELSTGHSLRQEPRYVDCTQYGTYMYM